MGWSCDITCVKDILEKDIDTILNEMPDGLGLEERGGKQGWGWICACDVWKPVENKIRVSGSYSCSGKIMKPFVRKFKRLLKKHNYNAKHRWCY